MSNKYLMIEYEETEERVHSRTFHKNSGGWSSVYELQQCNILKHLHEMQSAINNDGFYSEYGFRRVFCIDDGVIIFQYNDGFTPIKEVTLRIVENPYT